MNNPVEILKGIKPVAQFIRAEEEMNATFGEFARGRKVEASLSWRIPMDHEDRRKNVTERPSIDIKKKTLGKIFDEQHEFETRQEVSIRIDFESLNNRISLDFGSIASNVNGLSFLVGSFFAAGDVRSATREARDTRLNHCQLPEKFGNAGTIHALANAAIQEAVTAIMRQRPSLLDQKPAA